MKDQNEDYHKMHPSLIKQAKVVNIQYIAGK